MTIQAEFSLTRLEGKVSIMIFLSLDGENKMGQNIGLSETHGGHIGEKVGISGLSEALTTLASSPTVLGCPRQHLASQLREHN